MTKLSFKSLINFTNTILVLVALLVFTPSVKSQEIGPFLQEAVEILKGSDIKINLLVEGEPDQVKIQTEASGGHFRYAVGRYCSVAIAPEKVGDFVARASRNIAIQRIEYYPFKGQVFTDSLLLNNRVDSVHKGLGFSSAYTGKGVIVGIIDTGVDFSHPDLKDSTGKTRIKYIWDQSKPISFRTPQPYNYGQQWNAFEIDNGLCTHDDPSAYFGHGTNAAGTAAGNGLAVGKYKGIAPEADIIVVATFFSNNNWLSTVADAVHYIFSKADSLNQPCVINASVGSFGGANDGADLTSKMIDAMLEQKRGRAFVCAAGNYGNLDMHLGYNITQEPKFTWFTATSEEVQFILWADTIDFNKAEYAFGADAVSGSFSSRALTSFRKIQDNIGTRRDSLFSFSGNFLGMLETKVQLMDFRYMMQVRISKLDSLDYYYRFITRGEGHLDIWATSIWGFSNIVKNNLPDANEFPDILNYVKPDNLQTLASSFQCSPNTITVGNYNNAKGYRAFLGNFVGYPDVIPLDIAPKSSRGPTRSGLMKPDLAATGDVVIAPGRIATIQNHLQNNQPNNVVEGGMHTIAGGTSTASPVVAGIVALYLEKCPKASYKEIKEDLVAAAYADQFTGPVPNYTWGYGKASAADLIRRLGLSAQLKALDNIQNLCEGDELELTTSNNFSLYNWSNGENTSTIFINQPGTFSVKVEDIKGCKAQSDSLIIGFGERPIQPMIWREENMLYSIPADSYKWFLDGEEIPNSNKHYQEVIRDGDYQVVVFSGNKCSQASDVFPAMKYSGEEWEVNFLPNPSSGLLRINIQNNFEPSTKIEVLDAFGKTLKAFSVYNPTYRFSEYLDLTDFANGIYLIRVLNDKNISTGKIVKYNQ
jgi:subtilisin family serine protease